MVILRETDVWLQSYVISKLIGALRQFCGSHSQRQATQFI